MLKDGWSSKEEEERKKEDGGYKMKNKNNLKLFLLDLLDENVYFNLSKLGLKKTTFVFLCNVLPESWTLLYSSTGYLFIY